MSGQTQAGDEWLLGKQKIAQGDLTTSTSQLSVSVEVLLKEKLVNQPGRILKALVAFFLLGTSLCQG